MAQLDPELYLPDIPSALVYNGHTGQISELTFDDPTLLVDDAVVREPAVEMTPLSNLILHRTINLPNRPHALQPLAEELGLSKNYHTITRAAILAHYRLTIAVGSHVLKIDCAEPDNSGLHIPAFVELKTGPPMSLEQASTEHLPQAPTSEELRQALVDRRNFNTRRTRLRKAETRITEQEAQVESRQAELDQLSEDWLFGAASKVIDDYIPAEKRAQIIIDSVLALTGGRIFPVKSVSNGPVLGSELKWLINSGYVIIDKSGTTATRTSQAWTPNSRD